MKVIVEGVIYDSEKCPIVIGLSEQDLSNIKNMAPDANVYAGFPDSCDTKFIQKEVNRMKEKINE